MSVILVFLLVIACISFWWLAQHRVTSKPWLEQGAAVAGAGPTGLSTAKIGLAVLLAVVGALFALFASAFFMRMELSDWQAPPLPRVIWFNTVALLAASAALQVAVATAREPTRRAVREALVAAGLAGTVFLAGQVVAWRELVESGYLFAGNPANSFFFLLTGLHGLHIVGGLVALLLTARRAWRPGNGDALRLGAELCATYWHFLFAVWLVLVVLLAGWAGDLIAICRQALG